MARTKVFISYSHKDEEWLERLRVHLKPVERLHGIDVWHDKKIAPGMVWHDEIREALAGAKVAVLLVTADFLASEFIDREEVPPLLAAAHREGATILPVIVNHSRFSDIESLAQYQAVNDPGKPLAGLTKAESDKVLSDLSRTIEQLMTGRGRAAAAAVPDADETIDEDDAEDESIAEALVHALRAMLEDGQFPGLAMYAEDERGEALDLMFLRSVEDNQLYCELVHHDALPKAAQRRLKQEFGFQEPQEPEGGPWLLVDLQQVDLETIAGEVLRVLLEVYEVPEEQLDWKPTE